MTQKIDSFFKPLPENESETGLTDGQQTALKLMKLDNNVFLTGPAGTGKSFVVDSYYKYAEKKFPGKVWKCATTGIAALNIGGKTIHSWAGIGLGEENVETLFKTMFFKTKQRWKSTKVLFIDEVSMLSPELLTKLDQLAKKIRNTNDPFGGIQVIFISDFFQLPVIKNPNFAFEAPCWKEIVDETVVLTENVRQNSDPVFQKMLNEIRIGQCSEDTARRLKERVGVNLTLANGIEPTRLYPKNVSVDATNRSKLKALPGKEVVFDAVYKIRHNYSSIKKKALFDHLRKSVQVKDQIKLKVGAQIMFKKNILEWDVVNGTRGIVKEFSKSTGNPIVELMDERVIEVEPIEFKYELVDPDDEPTKRGFKAVKIQVPVILAWSVSIHSSQGTTLDLVTVDCGSNIFECGQAYVALSRSRTLGGLSLTSFDPSVIEANQKVLDFYKTFDVDLISNSDSE